MSTLEKTKTIYELIQKEWKLLLTLFAAGVLFYIYPICHQAITLDNESHVVNQTFSWYLSSRRWGIPLFQKLFFMRTFVPSFWIIVNVALISLATVISCDLFKFKREWIKYLFGLLIISFPQYAFMMKFALTADAVGVGFVLIALGFWIYERSSSWKANLAILLLFIGTFSIYVSLIFIPLVLFLLLCAVRFSEEDLSIKDWFKQAVRLGIITVLAYVMYYAISKIILLYYGMSTETPEYFANMIKWGKDPVGNILIRIPKEIWKHYEGRAYFGEKPFVLVWIPFAVSLFFILKQKVSASKKVISTLLLIACMIAPFMQIILLGAYQPPRVFFAQAFLFAPLWCLALQRLPRIKPEWVLSVLAILFVHNGYRVTQAFHYDAMVDEAEKNLALRVLARLDSMNLELEKHPVLIIGERDIRPDFPGNKMSWNRDVPDDKSSNGKLIHIGVFTGGCQQRAIFFLQINGFVKTRLKHPGKERVLAMKDKLDAMPSFPAQGSVALIDDIIVIKLAAKYSPVRMY